MSEDEENAGNLQGKTYAVGKGKPPVATQFGGVRANKQNKRGRIVSSKEAFRKEFEKVWAEIMFDETGNPIKDPVDQKPLTRLKAQMRAMTTSTNVKKVELALSYTFGKPTEETKVDNTGEVVLRIVREETKKPDAA